MKDVTVEAFSRLVSGIYAAALTPQQWVSALYEMNRTLDGTGIALMIPDAACWYNSTLPEEASDAYRQYYHRLDRVAAATQRGPVGVVRSGTELMPLVRNSEFSDWLRPFGIDDALVVRLSDSTQPSSIIVAAPRRVDPFDAPERVELMRGLVPHLQQALRTQNRLGDMSRAKADLADALDTVRHGMVIVGSDLRVAELNSAAEAILRAEDGIRVQSATLVVNGAHQHRRLQRALGDALDHDRSGARGGRTLFCERPSRRRPYVVEVLPLHGGPADEAGSESRALVLIVDPDDEPRPVAALLRRRYGLTSTEADVAVRIARGADLNDICEQLSVSITTVRKHLQHVFDKTDTHRQAELVRLALTMHPTCDKAINRGRSSPYE